MLPARFGARLRSADSSFGVFCFDRSVHVLALSFHLIHLDTFDTRVFHLTTFRGMAENDPDPVPVFKPPNPVRESQKSPLEPVIPDLPAPLTGRNPPGGVYFLEIMKNGTIIGRMEIKENRLSFGRSRDADVSLSHPFS